MVESVEVQVKYTLFVKAFAELRKALGEQKYSSGVISMIIRDIRLLDSLLRTFGIIQGKGVRQNADDSDRPQVKAGV
jgi:hypothetical protein